MLELKHIRYVVHEDGEDLVILKDVSLTIDDHKLIVFTGPNGGGKTTLAKIIMGLVKPTSGQIIWNGQDITDLGITERARLGISYGFQQPPRFKGLTVKDLLTLAKPVQLVMHMASIRLGIPVPMKLTRANVKIDPGKAISISQNLIRRLSKTPPIYPAAVPIKIPIKATIPVTMNAMSRDVLPP